MRAIFITSSTSIALAVLLVGRLCAIASERTGRMRSRLGFGVVLHTICFLVRGCSRGNAIVSICTLIFFSLLNTCVLQVFAWGSAGEGMLGKPEGDEKDEEKPRKIQGLQGAGLSISFGGQHAGRSSSSSSSSSSSPGTVGTTTAAASSISSSSR